GWSKGKQMRRRCSSPSVSKNRATAVSAGAVGRGPAPSAGDSPGRTTGSEPARAAVPAALTNSLRERDAPSADRDGEGTSAMGASSGDVLLGDDRPNGGPGPLAAQTKARPLPRQ